VTLLALFFARGFHKKGVLTRFEGGLLVASYCAYICWLYFDTRT